MPWKSWRRLILSVAATVCVSCGAVAQQPKVTVDTELPLSAEQTAEAIISQLEVRAEPQEKAKAGRNPSSAAPLELYARRESGSTKRKRSASRDSCADQFGEDSGASRKPAGSDQMDSSG